MEDIKKVIEILRRTQEHVSCYPELNEGVKTAIVAMQELQKYREIGNLAEIKDLLKEKSHGEV